MRGTIGRVAFVAPLLALACSLVSPAEDTLVAPMTCAPGMKRCGEQCVSVDDPTTGCGAESCDPCSLPGAQAMCVAGQCRIGACEPGRGDCDGAPSNGCEAVLESDAQHCGACGASCALAGTETACIAGQCTVTGCAPNHADCNANDADGCEVDLTTSPAHCGACGAPCQLPQCHPRLRGGLVHHRGVRHRPRRLRWEAAQWLRGGPGERLRALWRLRGGLRARPRHR